MRKLTWVCAGLVGAVALAWAVEEKVKPSEVSRPSVTCKYDSEGRLVQVITPCNPSDSPVRFYSGDEMIKPVGPDGKAATFQYDKDCTYGVERDAQGRRTEYRYDTQGNLVSVTDTQAPYRYDPDAKLVPVRGEVHATR